MRRVGYDAAILFERIRERHPLCIVSAASKWEEE